MEETSNNSPIFLISASIVIIRYSRHVVGIYFELALKLTVFRHMHQHRTTEPRYLSGPLCTGVGESISRLGVFSNEMLYVKTSSFE